MEHIVIVGAGQAGASLAETLRKEGFGGRITLIGAEPEPPYQRPPLSKKYLLGEVPRERLYLRPPAIWAEEGIELRLGTPVTGIDAAARTVTLGDETLGWDALALTLGAQPRRLPAEKGDGLAGVHVVRSLADIDRFAPELRPGARLLIVGGGYIGLEAAAVAATHDMEVTLIEAAPRILGRVACTETADHVRALHAANGVTIREGTGLTRLTGADRVEAAELADGTVLPVDAVIVGIGVVADTALAESAGLALENGAIVVDETGQTSAPGIWAAGDCTVFPFRGEPTRLESVQNAVDQGQAVARNILGAGKAYVPAPWFWSDQYDLSLQIAGLNRGYDRVVVREGDKPGSRSHWYFAGDRLLACDAMNDARAYMVAKRLLEAGRSVAPEAVADPATELKTLLRG